MQWCSPGAAVRRVSATHRGRGPPAPRACRSRERRAVRGGGGCAAAQGGEVMARRSGATLLNPAAG